MRCRSVFSRTSNIPAVYSDWAYQRNDKYLTNNWTVVNKGTKNNGYPGDVIISWFKPLDEAFDGPDYTNEVYIMVVNGLTDPSGSAADCKQEIRLNFREFAARRRNDEPNQWQCGGATVDIDQWFAAARVEPGGRGRRAVQILRWRAVCRDARSWR